ncbi:uncharacterized protein LOC126378498 [Pectinophora gossypiella]|uniref:uncharacterized protein LOC126378498 n=1 Tax=Pectinophora gossypiella TaxID=13191 RepID=UPI00214EEE1F|nr:uncharacterized protein LOC126378498 [Pectinophora gossypiella]
MTTGNSGAVFFLGTRAHYQVLQQPESQYDVENGNSTDSLVYQKPELWQDGEVDNLAYCDTELNVTEEKDTNVVKRRTKRRQSETALCERDIEMKPALLNNINDNDSVKAKPRSSLLSLLASLARRKRRLHSHIQYLQHLETALTSCTYRESCRCLECQSRYFECDESDYSSEESEEYTSRYAAQETPQPVVEEDDDEVFIDSAPGDTASTDLLLAPASPPRSMSLSSASEPDMEIEVAAGTPVLLNYLLTHPITCSIQ